MDLVFEGHVRKVKGYNESRNRIDVVGTRTM